MDQLPGDFPWRCQPQSWTGEWWCPDAPDQKVRGTLRYDPDLGMDLTLTLNNEKLVPLEVSDQYSTIPILFGETRSRNRLTLLDVVAVGPWVRDGNGEYLQNLEGNGLLVGVHLPSINMPAFASGSTGLTHLLGWLAETGLKMNYAPESYLACPNFDNTRLSIMSATHGEMKYTARVTPVQDIKSRAGMRSMTIAETASITVNAEDERLLSLNEIEQALNPLSFLVETAADTKVIPLWTRLKINKETVPLYRKSKRVSPLDSPISCVDWLFTCNDISFADVVPKWLNLWEKASRALGYLLAQRHSQSTYEIQMQLATTAAEAFQKNVLEQEKKANACPVLKQAQDSVFEGISALSEDQQTWVKNLLTLDWSFRERMMRLMSDLPSQIVDGLVPNTSKWIGVVVRARNAVSHGNTLQLEEENDAALDAVSLATLLCILKYLGLDDAGLIRLATTHREFTWVCGRGQRAFPPVEESEKDSA